MIAVVTSAHNSATNNNVVTPSPALRELAATLGVAVSFTSFQGEPTQVSQDTIVTVINALLRGLDLSLSDDPSDDEVRAAHTAWVDRQWLRVLPPTVVTRRGHYHEVIVHVRDGSQVGVSAVLDDGAKIPFAQVEHNVAPRTIDGVTYGEAAFAVPEDLPLGWHKLVADNEGELSECVLAVTPDRLSTADKFVEKPANGVMAQLYSVRSERSWGIGDFHTLADLATTVAQHTGGDYVLINPLHAAEPTAPVEDSPYLPTTRRYHNAIYIRPEAIDEFGYLSEAETHQAHEAATQFTALNRSAEHIDRNPIYAAKLAVLRAVHAVPLSAARQADFERFLAREGRGIDDYARWCADFEVQRRREAATDPELAKWVEPFGAHENVDQFRADTEDFHRWLQWIADQQLAQAQAAAEAAGMRIGIMADLAVGVHPGGADAANLAEWLAPEVSVGAPPDGFNQQGQDWSQPPWNPHKLAEAGYGPWRDMLRTILRRSGGIRVDHILGLFRLWVMPRMQPPTEGTYLHFDHDAMVGILALEAELAGAAVIGEDLGTFEPWVQDYLADRGVMGTSILWFESENDGPKPPQHYRRLCLSSVTTHDLPPTAGYLAGEHIKLRDELGLFLTDVAEEDARDFAWIRDVLQAAATAGCFNQFDELRDVDFRSLDRDQLEHIDLLIEGLHLFLAQSPSALKCAALTDVVGDHRTQNQPGTTSEQYPNWCVPLTDANGKAVTVADLPSYPSFTRVIKTLG